MAHDRKYMYEALFLFPQSSVADLQAAHDHIVEILHRGGAEIISLKKWDERRLAFEVKGNKRGVYFLVFFKASGSKLAHIERDCNLSEKLLRTMITRADQVPAEVMQAAEGRAQLADEIKLRATQPQAALETETATVTADERDEEDFLEDEDL